MLYFVLFGVVGVLALRYLAVLVDVDQLIQTFRWSSDRREDLLLQLRCHPLLRPFLACAPLPRLPVPLWERAALMGLEFLKSGVDLALIVPLRMLWVPQPLQNWVSEQTVGACQEWIDKRGYSSWYTEYYDD